MKVDEDKQAPLMCLLKSLVRATSILWQASVPLGISRLLLLYYLITLYLFLSMFFV
ncbi:hypothetical protein AALP_AA3G106400 [Arabis alpina]|uniref:Uncharacterized protein n=1 Tax=Arabis alpina TaxID=50452 RepID=A0A087H8D0_ARAAL|nr:hypothetical protein AALP_AA3G106400 [Arabis alpina]